MIIGTGIDIIEVKRVERAIKRYGDTFTKKVFTDKEIAYSRKFKNPYERLAARFAVKEAVLKAMGDGRPPSLEWRDIEVSNAESGKPSVTIRGQKNKFNIVISMSHTKDFACASAILVSDTTP